MRAASALTPALPSSRLLLVEADPAVSAALQRGLRRAAWDVLWAPNGSAALRLKPIFVPDVVLLSLDLPDMDGGALVRLLAQHGDCAIVALSGRGEAARTATMDGGAHDYLTKPAAMRDILARLQAVARHLSPALANEAAALLCPA